MKKFFYLMICLLLVSSFGILPMPADAAQIGYSINEIPKQTIYPLQLNIPVLDFTLMPSAGDKLNAITIRNAGNARSSYISKVVLYEDDGDGIFKGWKKDIEIGPASYYSPMNTWYWQNLDVELPARGKRFFVAVDMVRDADITVDRRTVQMGVSPHFDLNEDNIFDFTKDSGIYLASGNTGPESGFVNAASHTIFKRAGDSLPPISVITYPQDGDNLDLGMLTIEGFVKDQGGGSIQEVMVDVAYPGETTITPPTPATFFGEIWEYKVNLNTTGQYGVSVYSKDWNGNIDTVGDRVSFFVMEPTGQTYENSLVEASKDKTKVGEDVNVVVTIRDQDFNPVSGKYVELFSSKGDLDAINQVGVYSDAQGQSEFTVRSLTLGASLFYAKADGDIIYWDLSGIAIPASAIVEYETAQTLEGRLIKTVEYSTVYLLDSDNVRHVFPNAKIFFSWFSDFSAVETISTDELATYALGDNVRYKPGSLIKMPSVPKVYMIDENYWLTWLETEKVATFLFGSDWAGLVDDMSEAFFPDYTEGMGLPEYYFAVDVFDELLK